MIWKIDIDRNGDKGHGELCHNIKLYLFKFNKKWDKIICTGNKIPLTYALEGLPEKRQDI